MNQHQDPDTTAADTATADAAAVAAAPNPDMTVAEAAAEAAWQADRTAEAAAVATPAPAAAAAAEVTPAVDPIAAALAANTDAIRTMAEATTAALAAATVSAVVPETPVAPPRDFNAEHEALAAAFDGGDLTPAELAAKSRELTLEEADVRTAATLAADRAAQQQQQQQLTEQQADEAWKGAQATFFTDPGNAAIVDNPIKFAGFSAAVQVAAQEGLTDNALILARARELVTGIAPVDQAAALRQAAFDRSKEAGATAPTTLRDVPNTAAIGDNPGASLDNLDISSLEDRLFVMDEASRNRYLETAPGGLQDNQRAVS